MQLYAVYMQFICSLYTGHGTSLPLEWQGHGHPNPSSKGSLEFKPPAFRQRAFSDYLSDSMCIWHQAICKQRANISANWRWGRKRHPGQARQRMSTMC